MELEALHVHRLQDGPYFEFNIYGDEAGYTSRDGSSLFLQEAVFGAFVHCFEDSIDRLNYYGPTRFASTELLKLQNELEENETRLRATVDPESFFATTARSNAANKFFLQLKYEDYDWELGWKALIDPLIEINNSLLDMVNRCIREDRVLWVLGI